MHKIHMHDQSWIEAQMEAIVFDVHSLCKYHYTGERGKKNPGNLRQRLTDHTVISYLKHKNFLRDFVTQVLSSTDMGGKK